MSETEKTPLVIPGTVVNYPVAHGNSNAQYLRHFLDGSYNENGTIFMDADGTEPGVVDQQTTLYGHHMNDGSMFKVIDDTLKQDEFNKIEHVYYITPDATYMFKPMFTAQVQDDYTSVSACTRHPERVPCAGESAAVPLLLWAPCPTRDNTPAPKTRTCSATSSRTRSRVSSGTPTTAAGQQDGNRVDGAARLVRRGFLRQDGEGCGVQDEQTSMSAAKIT